jgi:hypothetical protein
MGTIFWIFLKSHYRTMSLYLWIIYIFFHVIISQLSHLCLSQFFVKFKQMSFSMNVLSRFLRENSKFESVILFYLCFIFICTGNILKQRISKSIPSRPPVGHSAFTSVLSIVYVHESGFTQRIAKFSHFTQINCIIILMMLLETVPELWITNYISLNEHRQYIN